MSERHPRLPNSPLHSGPASTESVDVNPIELYWWSPLRDPRVLVSEIRHSGAAWWRSSRHGGVPLRNFGDELSAVAVKHASGRSVTWTPAERAEVFGVGSILETAISRARADIVVWGSGLRGHEARRGKLRNGIRFAAVRGRLTQRQLSLGSDVAIGDPGLLAREIFGAVENTGSTKVMIPHFSDFNTKRGRSSIRAAKLAGYRIVGPTTKLQHVVDEIKCADVVLTSSLHGKVVSDALGVRSALVDFNNREPRYKYDDYMSAWGLSAEFIPVDEAVASLSSRQLRRMDLERTAVSDGIEQTCAHLRHALAAELRLP